MRSRLAEGGALAMRLSLACFKCRVSWRSLFVAVKAKELAYHRPMQVSTNPPDDVRQYGTGACPSAGPDHCGTPPTRRVLAVLEAMPVSKSPLVPLPTETPAPHKSGKGEQCPHRMPFGIGGKPSSAAHADQADHTITAFAFDLMRGTGRLADLRAWVMMRPQTPDGSQRGLGADQENQDTSGRKQEWQ